MHDLYVLCDQPLIIYHTPPSYIVIVYVSNQILWVYLVDNIHAIIIYPQELLQRKQQFDYEMLFILSGFSTLQ